MYLIYNILLSGHWGWITILNTSCNENFWIGLNTRGRRKNRERIKWHNFNCYMYSKGSNFSVVLQWEEFCLGTSFSLILTPQEWWNLQATGWKEFLGSLLSIFSCIFTTVNSEFLLSRGLEDSSVPQRVPPFSRIYSSFTLYRKSLEAM